MAGIDATIRGRRLTEVAAATGRNVTFRKACAKAGLGKRHKRRPSIARMMRERMANEGLLLQLDGLPHRWNGREEWCLVAAIDDATSQIPAAQFFPTETTWACMTVLRTIIERFGVPEALYVDGAGWAGGGPKRLYFSQFVRACEELGIRVVPASSAEAKGRIERAFRTLQERLIPELDLVGIQGGCTAVHSRPSASRRMDAGVVQGGICTDRCDVSTGADKGWRSCGRCFRAR